MKVSLTLVVRCQGGFDGSFEGLAGCASETKTVSDLDSALCIVALAHNCTPVTQLIAEQLKRKIVCFSSQSNRLKYMLDQTRENYCRYILGEIAL